MNGKMVQMICKGLSVAYDGLRVLNDVSFEIESGEYVVVIGGNGTGKSTLIKAILRLIPTQGGSVAKCGGFTVSDIGYLPQHAEIEKNFPATVSEVVMSGCIKKNKFFYNAEDKARCGAVIDALRISQISRRRYCELSGGQQQRVLLARAMCAARKMLILDEPTAGLDPVISREFYRDIDEINKKDGMTIVMVTHDIDAALEYADKIICIDDNSFFCGSKKEYLAEYEAEGGR